MHHILKCIVLLSSSFLIQAYRIHRFHPNRTDTHIEMSVSANVRPNREYVRVFVPHLDYPDTVHLHRTISHIKAEDKKQRRNNHSKYAEKASGTNYSKLNLQQNNIPRFEDKSHRERQSTDKENGNSDRLHQDNYTGRQSRPVFGSNSATSNVQLVSRERSRNDQYEKENLNNVRNPSSFGESREVVHSGTEYPRYFAGDTASNHDSQSDRLIKEAPQLRVENGKSYTQQYGPGHRKQNLERHVKRFDYRTAFIHPQNMYDEGRSSPTDPTQNEFRYHDSPLAYSKSAFHDQSPPVYRESYIPQHDHKPNHPGYGHGSNSKESFTGDPNLTAGRPNEQLRYNYELQQGEQDASKHSFSSDDDVGQEKDESNSKQEVEDKQDMESLASEEDSKEFVEEHDGFLDMGAYTDERGSFGWYADFPVGKEHDKVTYSFS